MLLNSLLEVAIAHAVSEYLINTKGCLTLFVTHYQNLAQALMKCMEEKVYFARADFVTEEASDQITFLYRMVRNIILSTEELPV